MKMRQMKSNKRNNLLPHPGTQNTLWIFTEKSGMSHCLIQYFHTSIKIKINILKYILILEVIRKYELNECILKWTKLVLEGDSYNVPISVQRFTIFGKLFPEFSFRAPFSCK